jgi:glucosamine 6-phosphate synthetase-like amidotransferase/phosphosugar isomerase protein
MRGLKMNQWVYNYGDELKDNITINRLLAFALGANEALLYSDLLQRYEYCKKHNFLTDEDSFHCTVADIEMSTTFRRKKQENLFKKLVEANLIKVTSTAFRYVTINQDKSVIKQLMDKGKEELDALYKRQKEEAIKSRIRKQRYDARHKAI